MQRRSFLQTLGATVTFGGVPLTYTTAAAIEFEQKPNLISETLCPDAPPFPAEEVFCRSPEAYWAELRRQWVFRPGFLYLNNGTVGSSPLPVLRAFIQAIIQNEQLESDDTEQYPLWGYGSWDEYRRPIAEFIGARLEEVALTRNSTEGLNYVANGLDLNPDDEVLTTDEEHPSGLNPWLLKAKRYGTQVKQITLPKPPKNKQQILDLLDAARSNRTRVVLVSHVSTATGLVTPVREICAWARSHGILTLIDGAHAVGMLPVNVKDLGCDFYVSSLHKWLLAPLGCGLFYVRDELCDRLWNTIATRNWDNRQIRAARLMQFGSTNVSLLAGLKGAIDFWHLIGPGRIERRIRDLHAYLKQRMAELPGAELHSAQDEELTGGILAVNFPGVDRMKLQQWLYGRHRIRIRGTSPTRLRLSTHIYHSYSDLNRFLSAIGGYLQNSKSPAH